MDRSDIIKLVTETKTQDALGVYQITRSYTSVFCNVSSVSQSEFFEGGRTGLNPAYKMTLFYGDYHGEEILEYKGQTYAIYRTYQRTTDTLELYVERKGGTNGKQQTNNAPTTT